MVKFVVKFFKKLYNKTEQEFFEVLEKNLEKDNKMFIVTANPEAFTYGEKDKAVEALLMDDETTVVADGIGIVKGAGMIGISIPERIPGVGIAEQLFVLGNKLKKSVYLFGAKQEVIETLCKVLTEKYCDLEIKGAVNGYVGDKDAVFEDIKKACPDIILVALGVPNQEKLIYKHIKDFQKGIFVGVGGSFDVLSGIKARAPKFFINNNIEWLYRILKEPKRIKRFYQNNIKFIFRLKRKAKKS